MNLSRLGMGEDPVLRSTEFDGVFPVGDRALLVFCRRRSHILTSGLSADGQWTNRELRSLSQPRARSLLSRAHVRERTPGRRLPSRPRDVCARAPLHVAVT